MQRSLDARLAPRAFWLILGMLLLVALALRLATLDEYLRKNPVAQRPWTDALTYWRMAGDMAGGQWVGKTPFLSAPLYPYFLGVVRTLGGGLRTAYVSQLILHLLTAGLLAWVARLRFGPLCGILAAAFFLALTEPAVSFTRVLPNTVQLLLVVLVWWRWVVVSDQQPQRWRDIVATGVLIGLLALAYPPGVLLVPAYAAWLWWTGGHGRAALVRALAGAACGIAAIAPATIHNAYACGEFIPITAHAGITMRQGNGPASQGVYTYVKGISPQREKMHESAAHVFEQATGRKGSWREIDRFFRNQVFTYWSRNQAASVKLLAAKAYWFLTSRNYDDMMPVVLEREYGFADRAILAPLATPWLLGAAVAGLIAVLRRPVRFAPEWLLIGLPLLVAVVFFYTPRYRLPAIPVVCALAAYALVELRRLGYPRAVALALCVAPVPLTSVNRSIGFDSPEITRPIFVPLMSVSQTRLGEVRLAAGDVAAAEQRFRAALDLLPENPEAHQQLGILYLRTGRTEKAIEQLRLALEYFPPDAPGYRPVVAATWRHLANARLELKRYAGAAVALHRAVELEREHVETRLALAWLLATCPEDRVRTGSEAVQHAEYARIRATGQRADILDVLAATYAEVGRFEDALATATEAAKIARSGSAGAYTGEIETRIALYRSGQPCRAAPRPVRGLDRSETGPTAGTD